MTPVTRPSALQPSHRMTGDTSDAQSEADASSPDQRTEVLPEALQSPQTKLVYLYLRAVDGARVEDLKRALGIQALTLYPILERLIDHQLVERGDDGYVMPTGYEE